MSNFPPGVTGNERAIAGYDERTATKYCDASAELRVMPATEWSWVNEIIGQAHRVQEDFNEWEVNNKEHNRQTYTKEQLIGRLRLLANNINSLGLSLETFSDKDLTVEVDECGWEGEVDTQYGDGYEWWECPRCGKEHEEPLDEYPDDPRI